jgi:TPR repeat protein
MFLRKLLPIFFVSIVSCAPIPERSQPLPAAEEKLVDGMQVLRDVEAVDKSAALDAFQEACQLGNNNGCHKVGTAYGKGLYGLPQNSSKARQWYLKAAIRGYAPSQQNLANLHAYRLLESPDDIEGYKWLLLAEQAVTRCLPGTIEARANTSENERKRLCQLAAAGQGRLRSIFRKRMSPEQLRQAESQARQWAVQH